MHVIGTAGHVDHGKSTLIAALTGTHPDRLKEEQEREMTIDLGFAWLTLPSGEEVGIVDVPGHRDFIGNMLAGVGGIDAALLVVAADEGVMPQTREHLAILDLLQVSTGLIALTKIDLVGDNEQLDSLEVEIKNVLSNTVLRDAPLLRVSSATKAGLPELLQTLNSLLLERPSRPDLGRPRLPVDRVFSMPGFGTVVTGTLSDGHLAIGDEVEILPSGLHARVRGLQTHRKKEDRALPGSRTAINLAGIDVKQVRRGEVVTLPGTYAPSQRLDVHFRLSADASSPLRHHTEVKVFLGAAEAIADLRLLGAEILDPGESGWLQLELRSPVVAARDDRYILRQPSPGETLGGGAIVDPHPAERHKRFDERVIKALENMTKDSPTEVLLQIVLAHGPSLAKDILRRSQLETNAGLAALEDLLVAGRLIRLGEDETFDPEDVLLAAPQWTKFRESVLSVLSQYHVTYPLRRGMPREELKSRLKVQPRLFNLLMIHLGAEGSLVEGSKWISLTGHTVRFSPFQQVKVNQLLARFAASPFAPPSVKECQVEVGEEMLNVLLESGDLVAVSPEVIFRKEDYQTMVARIEQTIRGKGPVTLAEVRDLFQTSRKYTQALLEHLDAIGVTFRQGDARLLGK